LSLQTGWKHFPFEKITLKCNTFPSTLNGLSIIQLSDLHIFKNLDINYLQTLVKKINELKPDIVVFTGDIIQTSSLKLKKHLMVFKLLKSPAYYVTGNHDIFYGPKPLKKILQNSGVICLDNKILNLHIKNTTLQLVGLSDRYSFARGIKRPIKELFNKLDPTLPTILLAHQPKDIHYIKNYRIDIQLSGHTHGGQVYPFNYIVRFFQPFFSGLYTHNRTLLYVSSGVGYWGVRMRYKVPSQIPIFTIN
jgi:predicted MPP superfamily phosphohydrolase